MDKRTYDVLVNQFKKYPKMEICDGIKLIYHAEFGGGYSVKDEFSCIKTIEEIGSNLSVEQLSMPYFEDIGGGYCRMNLSVLGVLPVVVVGRMFMESGAENHGNIDGFNQRVEILRKIAKDKKLSFTVKQLDEYMEEYYKEGVRPVHHSAEFIESYKPAYRVVKKEYCKFLEAFIKISRLYSQGYEVTVGIDGQRASGKTTLAELLPTIFECNVFKTSNFLCDNREEIVTAIEEEVCKKLNTGDPFSYNCYSKTKKKYVRRSVIAKRLNIIQGTYALHPNLDKYYELRIFMEVNPVLQAKRVLREHGKIEGTKILNEHIPKENEYIENYGIKVKSDIIYNIK